MLGCFVPVDLKTHAGNDEFAEPSFYGHGCQFPMPRAMPFKRTLRIDNGEAAPIERITANDENGFVRTSKFRPFSHGRESPGVSRSLRPSLKLEIRI